MMNVENEMKPTRSHVERSPTSCNFNFPFTRFTYAMHDDDGAKLCSLLTSRHNLIDRKKVMGEARGLRFLNDSVSLAECFLRLFLGKPERCNWVSLTLNWRNSSFDLILLHNFHPFSPGAYPSIIYCKLGWNFQMKSILVNFLDGWASLQFPSCWWMINEKNSTRTSQRNV